ncbi:MAG: hypothetical protein EZS28_006421 [Streblomastix strix]|uniref:Uncharacterized protein n=1 Tax=Streblomastix strix TaxID=222440 RepID=A0A5J4WSZ7_9EUKA|nr:MAG: hypothetical protein EZS28_006421 [Streblomastix strix]
MPAEQLTEPFVVTLFAPVPAIAVPLKDNVYPLALIYNSLVLAPTQDVTAIIKPQRLVVTVLGGVNINYYPTNEPVIDYLLYPYQIEELSVSGSDRAILKPSSQLVAEGFIQILPEVMPANDVEVQAFNINYQGILTLVQVSDKSVP